MNVRHNYGVKLTLIFCIYNLSLYMFLKVYLFRTFENEIKIVKKSRFFSHRSTSSRTYTEQLCL